MHGIKGTWVRSHLKLRSHFLKTVVLANKKKKRKKKNKPVAFAFVFNMTAHLENVFYDFGISLTGWWW